MKPEKTNLFFLTEDLYFKIPYNKFIQSKVYLVGEGMYKTKLDRYIFVWDRKVFHKEKQHVLLHQKKIEGNVIFLEIREE